MPHKTVEISDQTLISRFKAQDDLDAAEILLKRYERPLYGFLWNMLRTSHDAQDALQETLMKALRGLETYRESNHFKSWLFRIGRNEAINILRKRKRLVIQEDTMLNHQPDPSASDPLTSLQRNERRALLEEALASLPENEREVVLLRIHGEIPFKEIAAMLGCSINTALGRMHNAKKRLKERLKEQAA